MLTLSYKKGNLFKSLKEDVVYLHACNSQNVWGAGISLSFKKYFPIAYEDYLLKKNETGMGYFVYHNNYRVACLITSKFYGLLKDNPKKILYNTYLSLNNLLNSSKEKNLTIYSPKINSGYFETPWPLTEKVIKLVCEQKKINIDWTVWEL